MLSLTEALLGCIQVFSYNATSSPIMHGSKTKATFRTDNVTLTLHTPDWCIQPLLHFVKHHPCWNEIITPVISNAINNVVDMFANDVLPNHADISISKIDITEKFKLSEEEITYVTWHYWIKKYFYININVV